MLSLPKIRTDLHELDAINTANEAIKKIKEKDNKPFILNEINLIAYVTALIVTEEVGLRPVRETNRKKKAHLWKTTSERNAVIYPSWWRCKWTAGLRKENESKC